MNIIVTLAPESNAKPGVGDIVKLQIFLDEKVGAPGDGWEVVAPTSTSWLPAGSITVSTMSVRAQPADGNATKLVLEGLVHQPGALVLGSIQLRNQVTKDEVNVPETVISGTEVSAGTKPQDEPPWIQGTVNFGGWNWPLISVFLVVLIAAVYFFGRYLWDRLRGAVGRNLTNSERALNALANLQKYTRSKKPLQQAEWKKFSFELAGILRKYSDENFRFDSSDMTDREFLHELQRHEVQAPHVNLIGSILGTITEVRYGRKELDASVVPGLLLDARKFVESTTVQEKEGQTK